MKSNLLNNIKIASPCSADWDEMLGDNCKRFCSHCKLNVYNLSEMTQRNAENFLFEAEGQVCVRLYRRTDGTIITQDCPVGWQAIKHRVSRGASAAFGLVFGFFSGIYGFSLLYFDSVKLSEVVEIETTDTKILIEPNKLTHQKYTDFSGTVGRVALPDVQKNKQKPRNIQIANGRVENISQLKDEPVELWIK